MGKSSEEVEKKPKHRARRKKEDKPTPAKGLLDALKFIKPVYKKSGSLMEQHCLVQGGWMVGSNGILTIATPIQEDLVACPQINKFEEALKQVGEDLSITQLTEETISISSGAFKVIVPCTPFEAFASVTGPDPQGGVADEKLKAALKDLYPIASEITAESCCASILVNETKAVGTNGYLVLEIEHGLNLPPNVQIPKTSAMVVAKTKKKLTGFGYTGPSCTFWFEDGSFIKTQLFNENYPDFSTVWPYSENVEPSDAPTDFVKASLAMESFSKDGNIYFKDGSVCSDPEGGSTFEMPGLPAGSIGINAKYLKLVKTSVERLSFVDIDHGKKAMYFYAENKRGMIMGVQEETEV